MAHTSTVKRLTITIQVEWTDGVGANAARKALKETAFKERVRSALCDHLDGQQAATISRDMAAVVVTKVTTT